MKEEEATSRGRFSFSCRRPSSRRDLEKYYKYVYTCSKCKALYGSDRQELKTVLCPICDEHYREAWVKKKKSLKPVSGQRPVLQSLASHSKGLNISGNKVKRKNKEAKRR